MLIDIEETLNPNVRNFYFDKLVLPPKHSEYADDLTSAPSQLLKSILDLHEIRQVLLLPDMLFVCKKDQGDWSLLSPQIMAELVEYDFGTFQNFDFSKQDIKAQTEALIEARVRPFLMRDGGNIEVLSLDNGCLKVRLKGKCHGCIHAAQTMQNAVENVIKKYIPSVISVHKED